MKKVGEKPAGVSKEEFTERLLDDSALALDESNAYARDAVTMLVAGEPGRAVEALERAFAKRQRAFVASGYAKEASASCYDDATSIAAKYAAEPPAPPRVRAMLRTHFLAERTQVQVEFRGPAGVWRSTEFRGRIIDAAEEAARTGEAVDVVAPHDAVAVVPPPRFGKSRAAIIANAVTPSAPPAIDQRVRDAVERAEGDALNEIAQAVGVCRELVVGPNGTSEVDKCLRSETDAELRERILASVYPGAYASR